MMEVSLGKENGVLIEKTVKDDDVENKKEASTSKVAPSGEGCGTNTYGLYDSYLSDDPSWSSECMNEKRQKRKLNMGWRLHTLNDDDDFLQLDDLVFWQHDNYHEDNKEEEIVHLFAELDQLLEHEKRDGRCECIRSNPVEKTDNGIEYKEMEANEIIIMESDTSSYDISSDDIASSKGPSKELLKWYDDLTDEKIHEFDFSKSTASKAKASKLITSKPTASKSITSKSKKF
nr:hypothetical protein [Tanacetum cinerariifolium]